MLIFREEQVSNPSNREMLENRVKRRTKRAIKGEESKRIRSPRYFNISEDFMTGCELYDLGWIKYYWCPQVYKPSDDTLLLIEIVEHANVGSSRILEIGTGTGIVLAYILSNTYSYGVGIDINPIATYNTYITLKLNNLNDRAEVLNCDTVSCIRKGTVFDIILYNPPYLIGEPQPNNYYDLAELGGSEGINNLESTLRKLLLNKNVGLETTIYVIIAEPPPIENTIRRLQELGFNAKILKTKHFFYEKIHGVKLEVKNIED